MKRALDGCATGSLRLPQLSDQELHPHADQAAEAAEAAAAQGKFWEMYDHLYEHQQRLTDPDLHGYAEEMRLSGWWRGLPIPMYAGMRIIRCIAAGTARAEIDYASAIVLRRRGL